MVIVNHRDVSSVTSDATHCMNKHGRKQIESNDAVLKSQWTDGKKSRAECIAGIAVNMLVCLCEIKKHTLCVFFDDSSLSVSLVLQAL